MYSWELKVHFLQSLPQSRCWAKYFRCRLTLPQELLSALLSNSSFPYSSFINYRHEMISLIITTRSNGLVWISPCLDKFKMNMSFYEELKMMETRSCFILQREEAPHCELGFECLTELTYQQTFSNLCSHCVCQRSSYKMAKWGNTEWHLTCKYGWSMLWLNGLIILLENNSKQLDEINKFILLCLCFVKFL